MDRRAEEEEEEEETSKRVKYTNGRTKEKMNRGIVEQKSKKQKNQRNDQ